MSYITTAPVEGVAEGATPSDATAKPAALGNNSSNPAKRAFAPMDVHRTAELKPDVDWYLAKQLFPPIERLCAPIAGISAGSLAECLGLDPKRYASSTSTGGVNEVDINPLDSQLPDSVRYKDCPRLTFTCLKCQHAFPFEGLTPAAAAGALTPAGLTCPACYVAFKPLSVVAQVEHQIRLLTSRYYDAWVACDDEACGVRSRGLSVYGHRCLGPQRHARYCTGHARYEVSGKLVGGTLGYWKGLFDVDRVGKGQVLEQGELAETVQGLKRLNRVRFDTVKRVVESYEKRCGWVWVQMDGLFAFAMK